MRIGDIARALRITVGAASKLIDRIEAQQLVARQPDSQDRRASIVVLCHTGREQVTAARTTYASEVQRILDAAFTPAEQAQFHMFTRRMHDVFTAENAHTH
jgi:DNA-binding MarR family transcriptional regulator